MTAAAVSRVDATRPASVLIIRRDNIGDLVCTTPLLASLRRQLPFARIDMLVTRYNRAVLSGNPDVTRVFDYVKAKHREPGESVLNVHAKRIFTLLAMRRVRYDCALLPGGRSASALRLARWVAPRVTVADCAQDGHEVERCCRLLTKIGLEYETPATRIFADLSLVLEMRGRMASATRAAPQRLIAVHISARKVSQQWPAERFAALIRRLHAEDADRGFVLLWSPGAADNPLHPGDDDKAAHILAQLAGLPVFPTPTSRLEDLVAVLSICSSVICADGGAMHLAAGLGKPIVALFGQSDAARWHPWKVPHTLLQPQSRNVSDIQVDEVVRAIAQLDFV